MKDLPSPLLSRLSSTERVALAHLLCHVDDCIGTVYEEALKDHQESRGHDAQLFGLKIYKELRFELIQLCADEEDIVLFEENGTYAFAIGPLRIRVDSLGHHSFEDVLGCFPDSSPAKQAFGAANGMQMVLEFRGIDPTPEAAAYELDRLTIGHFGNSREGLVKWYLGAWTHDRASGQRAWAWIHRLDETSDATSPPAPERELVPFDQREADPLTMKLKRSA